LKACELAIDAPVRLGACTAWCTVTVGKQHFFNDEDKDPELICWSTNGEISIAVL
jgi:hypothetical protein